MLKHACDQARKETELAAEFLKDKEPECAECKQKPVSQTFDEDIVVCTKCPAAVCFACRASHEEKQPEHKLIKVRERRESADMLSAMINEFTNCNIHPVRFLFIVDHNQRLKLIVNYFTYAEWSAEHVLRAMQNGYV